MKITKYPQSCLILEKDGKKIIIDPGSFVSGKFKVTDLLPLEGILITHEHSDHTDPSLIRSLVGQTSTPVVGNESTSQSFKGLITKVVGNNETFELAGFNVKTFELPHCLMVDGTPGPQNTGYIIDSVFFHPGDGLELTGLKVETAAAPIAGPDVSPKDIYSFVKSVGCVKVIPIHYDYFPNDPNFVKDMLFSHDKMLEVITLNNGDSVNI